MAEWLMREEPSRRGCNVGTTGARLSKDIRACSAFLGQHGKNSMQNVYGFSPNQLVFGTNPNLPNIMTEGLPALEGKTSSEVFADHMNALHASRNVQRESGRH